MSDLIPDSYYDWIFVANTGDQYAGFMYNDTGAYPLGQVLPTAYGYYPRRFSSRLTCRDGGVSC